MSDAQQPGADDPELDALLGAYALDALDDIERARVDRYLAVNRRARDEVDELRESAASLALAPRDDLSAPPELWERISSSIAAQPRATTSAPPRFSRARLASMVLAVAAAIAIVVLAVQVAGNNNRGRRDVNAAFASAWSRADARKLSVQQPGGAAVARIVLLPDGTSFLRNDAMQALPPARTYQLWALSGDPAHPTAISEGVLGAHPGTIVFHTPVEVRGFGITVEKSPGVVSTTQALYASAAIA